MTGNEVTRFSAAASIAGYVHWTYHPTTMNDLIEAQDDQLFYTINHNPSIYFTNHYLLSPPSAASQSYDLRHRAHNRSLPDRAGHIYQSVMLPISQLV